MTGPTGLPTPGYNQPAAGSNYYNVGPSVVKPKMPKQNVISIISMIVVFALIGGMFIYSEVTRGKSTTPVLTEPSSLRVGDCFANFSALPPNFKNVGLISCSAPHEAEVFFIAKDQPDNDDANYSLCRNAFADYVGVDYDHSKLSYGFISTSRQNYLTVRVTCIVYDETNFLATSSYKNSGR